MNSLYCICDNIFYTNLYYFTIRNKGENLFLHMNATHIIVYPIKAISQYNQRVTIANGLYLKLNNNKQLLNKDIVCPFCEKVFLTVEDCSKINLIDKYSKDRYIKYIHFFKSIHKNLKQG